jgi:23S rRNA pseudouridine1911/1915/1917 synthase
MSAETLTFTYAGAESVRLDKALVSWLPEQSRNRLQNLIREGFVRVNSVPVQKNGHALQPGDRVQIELPPASPGELIAEDIPLDILFENADLLVINKPAGMVVHPAAGHVSGTLAHAVLGHAADLEGVGGEQRPGIVHRLDKDTSGIILVAKNDRAHRWLQEQFKQRLVKKTYIALVDGHPPTPQGRIEAPIARDPAHRKRMAVVPPGRGREAVTEYRVIENFHEYDLIEAAPLTGRTHQIRLHLAFIGCPIVGDTVYGRRKPSLPLDRHFLHASSISFRLPGEEHPRTFTTALPRDLEEIVETLRSR